MGVKHMTEPASKPVGDEWEKVLDTSYKFGFSMGMIKGVSQSTILGPLIFINIILLSINI